MISQSPATAMNARPQSLIERGREFDSARRELDNAAAVLNAGAYRPVRELRACIEEISNRCLEFDRKIESDIKKENTVGAIINNANALRGALKSVKGLQSDQCLRLKADEHGNPRIVTFGSRSFFKQLFGIGSTGREQQAQALATKLGISQPRVAPQDIRGALTKAESALATAEKAAVLELMEKNLPLFTSQLKECLEDVGIADAGELVAAATDEVKGRFHETEWNFHEVKGHIQTYTVFRAIGSALERNVYDRCKDTYRDIKEPVQCRISRFNDLVRQERELASINLELFAMPAPSTASGRVHE